jgi:hypothetical protein
MLQVGSFGWYLCSVNLYCDVLCRLSSVPTAVDDAGLHEPVGFVASTRPPLEPSVEQNTQNIALSLWDYLNTLREVTSTDKLS